MARPGAGYCYIDVPHVHDYLPDRPTLYQTVTSVGQPVGMAGPPGSAGQPTSDSCVFTGDPVPFGYEGNKTVFYGHHPVPLQVEVAPPQPVVVAAPPHGPGPGWHGKGHWKHW